MARKYFLHIAVPLLVIAAILALLAPRKVTLNYDYRIGGTWNYPTLYAPFDFPVLKTQEQIADEIERLSITRTPYFTYSEQVTSEHLSAASKLPLGSYKLEILGAIRSIMERGVLADSDPIEDVDVICIQRNKRAIRVPANEVYVLDSARSALLTSLRESTGYEAIDSLLLAHEVYSYIVPNLEYDAQTTRAVNADNASRISPTSGSVPAGTLIVSEGEIITAEVAQELDSYKKEYEENMGLTGPSYLSVIGNILVALMLVTLFALAIYYGDKRLIFDDRRIYYVLFVFTLIAAAIMILSHFGHRWMYMVPLTLGALYLQAFVRARVIVPAYMVSLLPLLVYFDNGSALFVIFLSGGLVSILGFKYLGIGWKQFLLALVNFAAMALTYLALRLVGLVGGTIHWDLLRLLVASLLAVAGYPLIYLFERIFNLVSDSRLAELADTSNSLIRELEQKAPGTFQHSLQVMNMADFAARAVDANRLLLRVGALYHDIGKMANPQCFIENESLLNFPEDQKYHANLSPMQSAEDIIRHVRDGVELARKHRLPEIVVEFISTHHGTTTTGFFLSKYLAQRNARPEMRKSFMYPGPRPVTTEQVILMLCDSIEAASRTLKEHTPDAYSEFVDKIVAGKLKENQFDGSDISVRELTEVIAAIKTYLAQMHHGRVVYPEQKRKLFKLK